MEERRKNNCNNCEVKDKVEETAHAVIEIKGDIKLLNARINGSLEKISNFMESGTWWRRTIVGLAITLFMSVGSGMYIAFNLAQNYGANERQIQVDSKRLDVIEQQIRINNGKSF